MEVLTATGTVADPSGAVAVILGVVVLLLFAAVVVRAFAQLLGGRGRSSPRSVKPAPVDIVADDGAHAAALAGKAIEVSSERFSEQQEATRDADSELPRLSPETIAPLARTLERSRRLWVAERRVRAEVDALREEGWLVEQHVLEDSRRIPFVLAGPTGVFVLCATDGPWTIRDLQTLTALADRLQRQLRGWDGEIQVVMCLAFETTEIRRWVGGSPEPSSPEPPYRGWVIGIDDLVHWLTAYEPERGHGLRRDDIRRLDLEALPRWDEHQTARFPKTPNFG